MRRTSQVLITVVAVVAIVMLGRLMLDAATGIEPATAPAAAAGEPTGTPTPGARDCIWTDGPPPDGMLPICDTPTAPTGPLAPYIGAYR